ncbi:MAG: hypothetical protein ACSHW7_09655 [Patiriisocius sp.]|uniref:hypothetical protein n=1 Tax=Patiriisocius sp. TaxID=2822396 RepID=UPI003EF43B0F
MAEFRLPSSSYNELTKLIKAYSSSPKGANLDDISQSTAIHRAIVSKNSKFLVGAGIIEGGNTKKPTELGLKLGRALTFNKPEEIIKHWRTIVAETDFFKKMLTVLEVKGGMEESGFVGHIEYSSGQSKSKDSRAGSGAVLEILKEANLIEESNGKIISSNNLVETEQEKDEVVDNIVESVHNEQVSEEKTSLASKMSKKVSSDRGNGVTINLNIQLTVPETTDEKVYDKFFEAMKKHLLS